MSLPRRDAFPPSNTAWTVRRKPAAPPQPPLNRRYQVSWLNHRGEIDDKAAMGPAIPLFQDCFAGLGRGALIPTVNGTIPIEDILPGTEVLTGSGPAPLLWKGTTTLVPGAARPAPRLYRLPADALGLARPSFDLVLGPSARLVNRSPALRAGLGADAALVPVASLADGHAIIAVTPPAPVQIHHLGFAGHRTLSVNGVEIESSHPGKIEPGSVPSDLLPLFMSLFPHMEGSRDFGPLAMPRLTDADLDHLVAA